MNMSFLLKLNPHGRVPSLNQNSEKTAPGGAIDQIGYVLLRLFHAFAEALDCEKFFQEKLDIKDWFWRLDCKEGEIIKFLLCLNTESRHANKYGGSNIASYGVDSIPFLFLYTVVKGTICGRTIH